MRRKTFLPRVELTNFCAGKTPDSQLQESITRENELHHDIVQGDFLDTYRNLSYKSIMGQLWASEFCEQVLTVTVRSVLTVLTVCYEG